ncbi:helix-turn-helix transcriptional regulator [Clostridium cylindrosporum]|uniref:Putative transcriptional regulator n=1 Tax=Clostridium cylindrosporum DSM 605 TaxID=1121307 RepID=A0A0J8DAA6_CLOCY|nr:helix-turn-helix transcriptional regulator [Clostridium cylindrosporum]KMT22975.1 putative transcriptional regulator [Clostridium cylindrosporum DSM 605]
MNKTVRIHLIDLRNSIGLTQKQIAEKVGITTSYYGMIEQGVRTPKLDIAKKIAYIFNKKVEEIFFD